jgi:hypothetical protein
MVRQQVLMLPLEPPLLLVAMAMLVAARRRQTLSWRWMTATMSQQVGGTV